MNAFTVYTAPLSIVYAMASSGLVSYAMSMIFAGGMDFVILGTLSGGVAVLSSSVYITNPVYAIVIGIFSSIVTYFLVKMNNFINDKFGVLDSLGAFIFLIHGFLGACWATVNESIVAV